MWMVLSMALVGAPIFVLGLFFPLKPLWLHAAVVVVLCIPGFFALMAATKSYRQVDRLP
jgi:hypothetical protein